ncbi:MAG: hypothetical protein AAGE03_11150 [Pseudomonadota bacterium]
MQRLVAYLTALFFGLIGGTAAACVLLPAPPKYFVKPVQTFVDGAFEVEIEGGRSYVLGEPVRAVGNGLITQVVRYGIPCPPMPEFLLIVDCKSTEVLRINGVYPREARREMAKALQAAREIHGPGAVSFATPSDPWASLSVRNLFPPEGPLSITQDTEISMLRAAAEEEGFEVEADLLGRISEMKPSQRYDPFFGCRIFYPESRGATL